MHHYHCSVMVGNSKTVYSSSIIVTDIMRGPMMQDWHKYMQSTYSLVPSGLMRYDCVDLGSSPEQQQIAVSYDEKTWTTSNYKIVHVDYPLGAAPVASTVATMLPSRPSVAVYMSCSTAGTGGANVYYTGVFPADLRLASGGQQRGGAFAINGKIVDQYAVQEVLDRFQAYLTQQGDKFVPGNRFACDIKATEAEARAAQHKRAYEGGGCTSGCSKIVETGWKN